MSITSKVVLWLNKIFPEATDEFSSTVKKAAEGVEDAIAIAIAAIRARRS